MLGNLRGFNLSFRPQGFGCPQQCQVDTLRAQLLEAHSGVWEEMPSGWVGSVALACTLSF